MYLISLGYIFSQLLIIIKFAKMNIFICKSLIMFLFS